MLNPSTADADKDDSTIRRCKGFAQRFGYGVMLVVNLFDYRATDPKELKKAAMPYSSRNVNHILKAVRRSEKVICAWGTHGAYREGDKKVLKILADKGIRLYALGLTKGGYPKHPLYVPYNSKLVRFA